MSSRNRNLTDEIKRKAIELGFSKIGIARSESLGKESSHLQEWLAQGYHATMSWMERNVDKRTDPGLILPNANSVIVVAMNYYTPVEHSDDDKTGKISRYAWGDDYHEILHQRLEHLLKYIQHQEASTVGKVYVDTGPVMEKIWAQRAGIGWEGKHTNVITKEYGSWVFLGVIILNIELEFDEPAVDHCGTCTLCIEACPTQAIVEPYVIDSNLCISYLTIEHRGEIASELGEKFDRWIYGCDICQDVCPWNQKFETPSLIKEFYPKEFNITPDLNSLIELSREEHAERYRRSPMKRTKYEGLKRNAGIVLDKSEVLKSEIMNE